MERSKKHKVHISTTKEVSESRENYTKVVMQKQMLCSYEKRHQKSEKEIEIQDHQTTASITQEQSSSRYAPKLYIPSTLNIDLILWRTQLIVCA